MTPEAESTALPHTWVLSYLTGATTPTRVRIVTSRILWGVGACICGVAVFLGVPLGNEIVAIYQLLRAPWPFGPMAAPAPGTSAADFVWAFSEVFHLHPWTMLCFFFLASGTGTLPFLALLVRKGRRVPSLLAMTYLFVAGLLALVVIVELSGNMFTLQFDPGRHEHNWRGLLWLLLLPLGAILGAIVKDICAYLLWIAQNPSAEKPPVPFLPVMKEAHS